MLAALGEDPQREGLLKTPERVEQALRFLTQGYDQDICALLNSALFTVDYDEMVIIKDIDVFSLCEHHLLPFFGKAHVAYIPKGKVVGPLQDPAAGGRLRPPAAGPGAADGADRRGHPGAGASRAGWAS